MAIAKLTGNTQIKADADGSGGHTTVVELTTDGATVAVGQRAMAASIPIAIASDQTSLPVAAPLPVTLLNQAGAAQTVSGTSANLNSSGVAALHVGVNITAVSGTIPTLTLAIDALGADGIWYTLWTSTSQSTAGVVTTSIGPGLVQGQLLTGTIRLRWTIGGTVPSFTFSASIVGR